MNARTMSQIEEWIRRTFLLPGVDDRDHCHGLRKNFALPAGLDLDFLSWRHQPPTAPGTPHLFTLGLWKCIDGAATVQTARDMAMSLLFLRAAYAELLENAECRGWQRRHRFALQGNLIGRRFERNGLIDTLSGGGGELVFWTCAEDGGQVLIEPYYVDGSETGQAGLLEGILDHLAWERPPAVPSAPKSRRRPSMVHEAGSY